MPLYQFYLLPAESSGCKVKQVEKSTNCVFFMQGLYLNFIELYNVVKNWRIPQSKLDFIEFLVQIMNSFKRTDIARALGILKTYLIMVFFFDKKNFL